MHSAQVKAKECSLITKIWYQVNNRENCWFTGSKITRKIFTFHKLILNFRILRSNAFQDKTKSALLEESNPSSLFVHLYYTLKQS